MNWRHRDLNLLSACGREAKTYRKICIFKNICAPLDQRSTQEISSHNKIVHIKSPLIVLSIVDSWCRCDPEAAASCCSALWEMSTDVQTFSLFVLPHWRLVHVIKMSASCTCRLRSANKSQQNTKQTLIYASSVNNSICRTKDLNKVNKKPSLHFKCSDYLQTTQPGFIFSISSSLLFFSHLIQHFSRDSSSVLIIKDYWCKYLFTKWIAACHALQNESGKC